MGGSGGRGYRSLSPDISRRIEVAREKEAARLHSAVNEYVRELLAKFNARDVDLTNQRLDNVLAILADVSAIERIMLGGSVAKHTDVDGLSDVDALVILDRKELQGKSPEEVKAAFCGELHDSLSQLEGADVTEGRLAVTVRYRDGAEIQLLPALRSGNRVLLASPDGTEWREINPKRFQMALTNANQRLERSLVPAIKLLKSINADLPSQKQLRSYHIEALAVDAADHYSGSHAPRDVLIHLCKHTAERVLKPIVDITGQSRQVDGYLGGANSQQRQIVSQALLGIARRLETAASVEDWKSVFGNDI